MPLILEFSPLMKIKDHFSIGNDETPWTGVFDGQFPERERASFGGHANVLQARTPLAKAISKKPAIVIMIFSVPSLHVYVGLAEKEGILSRMQKHAVKAMGSNVGQGVIHPKNWQAFASERFSLFQENNTEDGLEDAQFSYALLEGGDNNLNKRLTGYVCANNNEKINYLYSNVVPGSDIRNVKILNDRLPRNDYPEDVEIRFLTSATR